MKNVLVYLLIVAAYVGCDRHVVRDHNVYLSEVKFADKLISASAYTISSLWEGKCGCVDSSWRSIHLSVSDQQCTLAADIYLIVSGGKWAWHSVMTLLNAGWEPDEIENLPEWFDPSNPPSIPPRETLCSGEGEEVWRQEREKKGERKMMMMRRRRGEAWR